MCLFTEEIEEVSDTRIFARMAGDTQILVYEMTFSSQEDLAMVLPIPVIAGPEEDAVHFISMEDFPDFFYWLNELFPEVIGAMEEDDLELLDAPVAAPILEVHQVGCFEASFVPQRKDFERLDERFRLPEKVWDSFTHYEDYGFVVFKLKRGKKQEVHPMAFSFPTRQPEKLFYPTVHVHDGEFHDRAEFDHTLFAQAPVEISGWEPSEWRLGEELFEIPSDPDMRKFMGFEQKVRWSPVAELNVVELGRSCYRQTIRGMRNNDDIRIPLNAPV